MRISAGRAFSEALTRLRPPPPPQDAAQAGATPEDARAQTRDEVRDADKAIGKQELSAAEQAQVRELSKRDAEVRAHEAAHAAAAGSAGGGTQFDYEVGPDGRSYAVGGEVAVRLETGRTPEETMRNMAQVRAAALAPANPSSQDRAVAAHASQLEARARAEAIRKPAAERKAETGEPKTAEAKTAADNKKAAEPPTPDDSERDLLPLERARARRAELGDRGHAHSNDGCGVCAQAVSRYK